MDFLRLTSIAIQTIVVNSFYGASVEEVGGFYYIHMKSWSQELKTKTRDEEYRKAEQGL